MRRLLSALLIVTVFVAQPVLAKSRIKDIGEF